MIPSEVLGQDSFAGWAEGPCPDGRVEPQGRSKRSWEPVRASTSNFLGNVTYVAAAEVVDGALGKHGEVLELRLPQGRGVAGNQNQLGLAGAERLEGALVSEDDLAGLHDKGHLGVWRRRGLACADDAGGLPVGYAY